MSIREQIIIAIVGQLKNITVANGYNFDFGLNINRANYLYDESELTAITVWPGEERINNKYAKQTRSMDVRLECFYLLEDETETNDAIANKIMADVQKNMGANIPALKSITNSVIEVDLEPVYPDDSNVLSVRIDYQVEYETVKGDPYLQ